MAKSEERNSYAPNHTQVNTKALHGAAQKEK